MTDPLDSAPLPPALERFSTALRRTGWIGFWVQLVLGIISTIILLFAFVFALPGLGTAATRSNPGTGGGLFFAICGLAVLYFSVYQSFRYTKLARQLRSPNPSLRPTKAYTTQILRFGLIASVTGMGLSLLGAGAINGTLVAKSLRQPGVFFSTAVDLKDFVQPLDLFVVQANTNTILAHFAGIVAILWLLDYINKPSN